MTPIPYGYVMNFNHLAIFDAVAREKNISRAAERLRISQPAVSKQLRLLEGVVGTPLADRVPKGVRLTAAGDLLADYARRIFALSEEAERSLAELQGLRRGQLTVGASTTIGIYFLPEILASYRQLYPQIDLSLEVHNTRVIQRHLKERRIDIAATEGFVHWPELRARVFLMDEVMPIVPVGHPMARRRGVTLQQFCAEPLLVREQGSGTREVTEEALLREGITVQPLMTLGSTEAIKRAVAAGVGVAFVSRLTIQQELQHRLLTTVAIKGFKIRRPLHVVQSIDQSISASVAAFLTLLDRAAKAAA
jgi:DNA-binding transcriptional LysR family regulator